MKTAKVTKKGVTTNTTTFGPLSAHGSTKASAAKAVLTLAENILQSLWGETHFGITPIEEYLLIIWPQIGYNAITYAYTTLKVREDLVQFSNLIITRCSSHGYETYKKAKTSGVLHILQMMFDPKAPAYTLQFEDALFDHTVEQYTREEFSHWKEFQMIYHFAKKAGHTDNMAHSIACNNPTNIEYNKLFQEYKEKAQRALANKPCEISQ